MTGKKVNKAMGKTSVLMIIAFLVMLIQCGCKSEQTPTTGFLTDYSNLREASGTSLRYLDKEALSRYSSFIVDRIEVHFHSGADAIEDKTEGKLSQQQINDLTNYMHTVLVEAVRESGNEVVYQPAAGVARIRAAITDINKSTAAALVPQAKLAGVGLGGASMEAEIVDSQTGEQIGAVVEAKQGSKMPFSNLGEWDAAKQVINDWGKRLQKRFEEVK